MQKKIFGKVNDNQFVNAGDDLMGVTDYEVSGDSRLVGHVASQILGKQAHFQLI